MLRAPHVEKLLTPVVGEEKATLLASLAVGMDQTWSQNPMIRNLCAPDFFRAMAAIYGTALRAAHDAINTPNQNPQVLESAQSTLKAMTAIVDAIVTAPAQAETMPQGLPINLADIINGLQRNVEVPEEVEE